MHRLKPRLILRSAGGASRRTHSGHAFILRDGALRLLRMRSLFGLPAVIAVVIAALATLATPAHAAESRYSNIDVEQCAIVRKAEEGDGEWAEWICEPFAGYSILYESADLRETIHFIRGARKMRLDHGIGAFNRLDKKLEWRVPAGGGDPYAVIFRLHISNPDGNSEHQKLMVAKVTPTAVCLVGSVDMKVQPSPNTAARGLADNAPGFTCGSDQPSHLSGE